MFYRALKSRERITFGYSSRLRYFHLAIRNTLHPDSTIGTFASVLFPPRSAVPQLFLIGATQAATICCPGGVNVLGSPHPHERICRTKLLGK
jgi:hypothetical protein